MMGYINVSGWKENNRLKKLVRIFIISYVADEVGTSDGRYG